MLGGNETGVRLVLPGESGETGAMAHKGGRRRSRVTQADLGKTPTKTQVTLAKMKNEKSHSWDTLAKELGRGGREPISGALVRRVTLGKCKSKRVERALWKRGRTPSQGRTRLSMDCEPDFRERVTAVARTRGITNGELMRTLMTTRLTLEDLEEEKTTCFDYLHGSSTSSC